MVEQNLLTEDEKAIVDMLSDVWNKFIDLPKLHQADNMEFNLAIHQAQLIIMARPVMRWMKNTPLGELK